MARSAGGVIGAAIKVAKIATREITEGLSDSYNADRRLARIPAKGRSFTRSIPEWFGAAQGPNSVVGRGPMS